MYINAHKAARLRKKDKCKLVMSKTKHFDGLTMSVVSKKEFEKHAKDWLKHDNVMAIWEGESNIIIAYKYPGKMGLHQIKRSVL